MQRIGIGEDLNELIHGKKILELSGLEKRVVIISYLSERPCSTSYMIATNLSISERGVLWHLRSMEKKDIIGEKELEGKNRFFIMDHIRGEDCHVFSILSEKKIGKIFSTAYERPGITKTELAEIFEVSRQRMWKLTKRLIESGLLKEVKDGRYNRYYLSKKSEELAMVYAERTNSTSSIIEHAIKKIGLNYEIIAHRNGILHLKIGDKEMTFSTDPFRSALEG